MKTFAVETSYISICFHCYVIAQQLPSPTYAVAMSLYQIILYCVFTPPKMVNIYIEESKLELTM